MNNNALIHHGELLKKFMNQKGLTPSVVADKLGRSHRNSIYGYYKSDTFSTKVIEELKDKLGFDIEQMLIQVHESQDTDTNQLPKGNTTDTPSVKQTN